MRTFDKSTKLDNVLYDVRGPVVDEAAKMEDEGKEILKLNIGNRFFRSSGSHSGHAQQHPYISGIF